MKKICNEVTHLKRKLKKQYVTAKIDEAQGSGKKTWNLLNLVTNKSACKDNTEPENLSQEKVNKYNKFFASVGVQIQKELDFTSHAEEIAGMTGFTFIPEKITNVMKLIDKIKPDVAVGNDYISARLIKDAKEEIAYTLQQIINTGYQTSVFPNCMKSAVIKAIHKKRQHRGYCQL